MRDFRIGNELRGRHVDAVANLLIQPRLWVPYGDYPDHVEWRDKAVSEVESERKRAMVAWWGNEEVAVCIYQRDPRNAQRAEIRNLSIEPGARGRGLAPFVLQQVVCEAAYDFPGVETIVADVKRTNAEMLAFALKYGFHIKAVESLEGNYAHNGIEDVVLSRSLV
jgi:RimJ/RimL family protein N-acetyltransferase